jgi:hypothetical protein
MEAYFDRVLFGEDLQTYRNASQALEIMREAYSGLEIGEFSMTVLRQILDNELSAMEEQYITKQVNAAGKNPLLREAVSKIAADRFETFSMTIAAIPENRIYPLHNVDFDILSLDGKINEEKLRAKHTYRAETERQKTFIALVQEIESRVESLREYIPEGIPLVGDDACFFVELDGSLHYNPAAIKVVE